MFVIHVIGLAIWARHGQLLACSQASRTETSISADVALNNACFGPGSAANGGGAINFLSEQGTPVVTVKNCRFSSLTSHGEGGAIFCQRCSLKGESTLFENCLAYGQGGAVRASGAGQSFQHCTFSASLSFDKGGAISLGGNRQEVSVQFCVFSDCHGSGTQGGVVFVENANGSSLFKHNKVLNCFAASDCQSLVCWKLSTGTSTVENCTFSSAKVPGIPTLMAESILQLAEQLSASILSCQFSDLSASSTVPEETNGFCIRRIALGDDKELKVHHCVFQTISVRYCAAAIHMRHKVNIQYCVFSTCGGRETSAWDGGGAVYLEQGAAEYSTVQHCIFRNNSVDHTKGGASLRIARPNDWQDRQDMEIRNCTFSDHVLDKCAALSITPADELRGLSRSNNLTSCHFTNNIIGSSNKQGLLRTRPYTANVWNVTSCRFDFNSAEAHMIVLNGSTCIVKWSQCTFYRLNFSGSAVLLFLDHVFSLNEQPLQLEDCTLRECNGSTQAGFFKWSGQGTGWTTNGGVKFIRVKFEWMVFSSDYGMFTAPWTVEFWDCYIANCENQAPNKTFMTFQQNVKVESTKVYSKTGGNIFNITGSGTATFNNSVFGVNIEGTPVPMLIVKNTGQILFQKCCFGHYGEDYSSGILYIEAGNNLKMTDCCFDELEESCVTPTGTGGGTFTGCKCETPVEPPTPLPVPTPTATPWVTPTETTTDTDPGPNPSGGITDPDDPDGSKQGGSDLGGILAGVIITLLIIVVLILLILYFLVWKKRKYQSDTTNKDPEQSEETISTQTNDDGTEDWETNQNPLFATELSRREFVNDFEETVPGLG